MNIKLVLKTYLIWTMNTARSHKYFETKAHKNEADGIQTKLFIEQTFILKIM